MSLNHTLKRRIRHESVDVVFRALCIDGGIEAPDLQQLAIKFVKDTSRTWYQPELTRDGGINQSVNQSISLFVNQ